MMQVHKACMVYTTYLPGYVPIPNKILTMQIRKTLFPPNERLSLVLGFFIRLKKVLASVILSLPRLVDFLYAEYRFY